MDIVNYIPIGHKNAVNRKKLCHMTGLTDRKNRRLIELAREHTVILNMGDSAGYFRPAYGEEKLVMICLKKELKRYRSIYKTIKTMKKFLSLDSKRDIPGQISMFEIGNCEEN